MATTNGPMMTPEQIRAIRATIAAARMSQEERDALLRQCESGDRGALFAVRGIAARQLDPLTTTASRSGDQS